MQLCHELFQETCHEKNSPVIFALLDKETLLEVALGNHELNRLASKYIYAIVEFNTKNWRGEVYSRASDEQDSAVYALEHRPELRSLVKSATIHCG